jgi:hypothetical protein
MLRNVHVLFLLSEYNEVIHDDPAHHTGMQGLTDSRARKTQMAGGAMDIGNAVVAN